MSDLKTISECFEPAAAERSTALQPGARVATVYGRYYPDRLTGIVQSVSEQTIILRYAIDGRRCFSPRELMEV